MAELDWIHDPQLKNMSHHKKEILTNLVKQSQGKSAAETIPILLNTQKLMQEQGVKFSPQEQNALFSVLSEKLNPQEKQRFDSIKKMMRF